AELPVEVDLLPGQMRHATRCALEVQHKAALEMILRAPQFGLRQRFILQPAKLRHHDIDQLADGVVRASRIDRHGAGITIRTEATEDRVREASLLPNVLEESRTHRAAENGVQNVARITILVILLVAARPETNVTLFELLIPDDQLRNHSRRSLQQQRAVGRHGTERALDDVSYLFVLDVPDGSDDHVRRRIDCLEVAPQTFGVQSLDGLFRAKDRASERVPLPETLREKLVDQIVGG